MVSIILGIGFVCVLRCNNPKNRYVKTNAEKLQSLQKVIDKIDSSFIYKNI